MRTSIPGKALLTVIGAFLALAVLFVWMHASEDRQRAEEEGIAVGPAEIDGAEQQSRLTVGRSLSSEDFERGRKLEVQRMVDKLRRGSLSERKRAALRLQSVANETAEPALLTALGDPQEDPVVAARCARALIEMWRRTPSRFAGRVFAQALADYDAADYEAALEAFNMCERELRAAIPEMYRLRAEIHLAQGRVDEAIGDCLTALCLKEQNFMAHYVQARCYLAKRRGKEALEEANSALRIYPNFEQAVQLKLEIESLQRAGEL